MTTTDLTCLTGQDMAAIALAMKQTALEAEQRIVPLERQLRAAANRPTIVQRSTALITGLVADPFLGEQYLGPFGGGTFVTDFNNTGVGMSVDNSSRTLIGLLGPGLYEVGISANVIASGVVNDNSYRIPRILISREDPTAVDGQVTEIEDGMTIFETNTGVGADFTLSIEVELRATDWIKFVFNHSNVGSTMNASIGTLVYLSKISSDSAVVVVT